MTQSLVRLFCFGDSITQGEGDPGWQGWVEPLKQMLAQGDRAEHFATRSCFNLGIGGETTDGLRHRFASEVKVRSIKNQKALALLQYGLNDMVIHKNKNRVPAEYFLANLSHCIEYAQQHQISVALIACVGVAEDNLGRIDQHGNLRQQQDIFDYNRLMQQLADNMGCHFIQPFAAGELAATEYFAADGVHPNKDGYQRIYHAVSAYTQDWLSE